MVPFIGTKTLNAMPMKRGDWCGYRGWEVPANEDAGDDGFMVEYTDGGAPNTPDYLGYVSWSPKDVFEAAYQPLTAMSFGHAVLMMQQGRRVGRAGWNGAGMFAYLVPAASYPVQTGAAKAHFGEGSLVPYRAYFALKTAQDDVATWQPSCSDVLANDWFVVDDHA
jgi:hypothetical protein